MINRFSRQNLEGGMHRIHQLRPPPIHKPKPKSTNRRKHINFKIEINKKEDIDIFVNFLTVDIKKRLKIDQKTYQDDNNECHLKHLNFILMEILLKKVLSIFQDNFENDSSSQCNEMKNIKDEILYVPEDIYKRDLTIINRLSILTKYKMMNDEEKLEEIAKYVYLKYKSFGFINLNFLKRKIYEFI